MGVVRERWSSDHAAGAPVDWRGLRDALGLTQEEMGRLLCVSKQSVCAYEAGSRRPTRAVLMLLRTWLQDPDLAGRLRRSAFPHPWPEDVRGTDDGA